MGLLEDGASFHEAVLHEMGSRQAEEDSRLVPWASEWTVELRDLLAAKGFLTTPLYFQKQLSDIVPSSPYGRTRTFDVEYFTDGWLLRGWRLDDGLRPIDVALTETATLWKLSSVFPQALRKLPDGRYASTENRDSHVIFYPNVHAAHRSRFVTLIAHQVKPAAYNCDEDEALRHLIGVPVAAAVQAGTGTQDGWIVGETKKFDLDLHRFRYR